MSVFIIDSLDEKKTQQKKINKKRRRTTNFTSSSCHICFGGFWRADAGDDVPDCPQAVPGLDYPRCRRLILRPCAAGPP